MRCLSRWGVRRYDRSVDRPIAAFDIETIPDPDLGRRLYDFGGSDADVIEAMLKNRRSQTGDRTDFHPLPFHRIVVLSVAWLDPKSGAFKLGSPAGSSPDEESHLRGFFGMFRTSRPPRLVTWNGSGFDLPVLRYRSMVHRLSMPEFYEVGEERRNTSYLGRFDQLHVDLMDVLSNFGASSRVRLDDWSRILGLPGKTVMHGSQVHQHYTAGDRELVRTYCELDALNTLLLYLAWRAHVGVLEESVLRGYVGGIVRELQRDEREAIQEFSGQLQGWRGSKGDD